MISLQGAVLIRYFVCCSVLALTRIHSIYTCKALFTVLIFWVGNLYLVCTVYGIHVYMPVLASFISGLAEILG